MKQPTPMSQGAAQQTPASNAPTDSGSEQVSPQEQAFYDAMVREALGIIYPEESPGEPPAQIVENLCAEFDPHVAELFAAAQPPVQKIPHEDRKSTRLNPSH